MRSALATLVVTLSMVLTAPACAGDHDGADVKSTATAVDVHVSQTKDGVKSAGGMTIDPPRYPNPHHVTIPVAAPACVGTTGYLSWQQDQYVHYGATPRVVCIPDPAAPGAPGAGAAAQVTPAMVRRAFERVPVPAFASRTQPAGKTLVNFDTIFFVEAGSFERTVSLLGRRVDLEIVPSRFVWVHGDGTSAVTGSPGAAYPSRQVTYRYARADVTVRHRVQIVWTASYRVDGGPWLEVPGSVTTTGPATSLRVSEAAPALSGRR